MRKVALACLAAALGTAGFAGSAAAGEAPDLRGKWRGTTQQVTNEQGYREHENTIEITDQAGRRFVGTVTHGGGTEKFIGVIRSDNKTLYWVDVEDDGQVIGELIRPGVMETCYLDAGTDAVAGCSILTHQR